MTAVTALRPKPFELHIPAFFVQSKVWKAIAFALGAAFVAGLYFGFFEVSWHIIVGSFHYTLFYWKHDWDTAWGAIGPHSPVINTGNYSSYRHNARNLGEPAAATLAVLSLAVPVRYWKQRPSVARMVLTPPVMFVVFVVLVVGGTWLELFMNNRLWPHSAAPGWVIFLQSLALGIIIGQVLHRIWLPVGARVQGWLMEKSVDHAWTAGGAVPWYITTEMVLAPELRERWVSIRDEDIESGEAAVRMAAKTTRRSRAIWVLVVLGAIWVLWVIALGVIGHFVVGVLGISVPYLAP